MSVNPSNLCPGDRNGATTYVSRWSGVIAGALIGMVAFGFAEVAVASCGDYLLHGSLSTPGTAIIAVDGESGFTAGAAAPRPAKTCSGPNCSSTPLNTPATSLAIVVKQRIDDAVASLIAGTGDDVGERLSFPASEQAASADPAGIFRPPRSL